MWFNMPDETLDIDWYISEYLAKQSNTDYALNTNTSKYTSKDRKHRAKVKLTQIKDEEATEELTDNQLNEILASLDWELEYFDKASEDYKTRIYQINLISKTKRYVTLEKATIAYYSDKLAEATERVQKIKDKASKRSRYGTPRNIFDREATKLANKVYENGYSAIANTFWILANLVIPHTLMLIAIVCLGIEFTGVCDLSILRYSFMSYAISVAILQYYSNKPRRYDRHQEKPVSRRALLRAQIAMTFVSSWVIIFIAAKILLF